MFSEVWPSVLCVYGLLYQILWPCSPPVILTTSSLNTQQYLGKWYFIAAAGERESGVKMFRLMDSTTFYLEETSVKDTLLLTGAMRMGVNCMMKTWTYNIHPGRDDLDLEGSPERYTLVWSGEWLNCTQCILLQETEPQGAINRLMLYARDRDLDTDVVREFQTKSSCHGMKEFVSLPQEKELCELENKA